MRHLWGGKPKKPPRAVSAKIVEQGGLWTLLRAYLEWSEVHGYSPATTEGRWRDVSVFVRWAQERGVVDWRLVDRKLLERYQRSLFHATAQGTDQPLATRTQAQRLSSLQAMFRFLVKAEHVGANPAADLEMPRVARRLPKHALTIDEVDKLMAVPDIEHPMGLRLRAMMEVFYSTGLRRMELINLAVTDVDFGHATVHVRRGKGGKDRFVPIGTRALSWVRKYLDEVRPLFVLDAAERTMFVANSGEPFTSGRLTQLMTNAVRKAELGKTGSCHLLRHTMATLMLDGGADIRYVQAMLGHSQLSTTEIYTHVSIAKLKEVHARTHPARSTP